MNTNICVPGPTGTQSSSAILAQLYLYRPNVPSPANNRSAPGGDSPSVATLLGQIDLETALKSTEAGDKVASDIIYLAERVAGLKAFRRKYYRLFFDEVLRNRLKTLAGIVVSKQWRIYYDALQKIGKPLEKVDAILNLGGLVSKLCDFQWDDLSERGIRANIGAGVSQWAWEGVVLGPAQTMQTVSSLVGDGASSLGFEETAWDIKTFSRDLEGTINSAKTTIDRIMSVSNARDVLTWDRSVYNPGNWFPVGEEAIAELHDLGKQTHHLFDGVVDAVASRIAGGASGGW